MKIISGILKNKNIEMTCDCCHCNFEIEDRNDFKIQYIRGVNPYPKIPDYYLTCPACSDEQRLGIDPDDIKLIKLPPDLNLNGHTSITLLLMTHHMGWEDRYKVSPIYEGDE